MKELRPVLPILIGVSIMLSLTMGIRQSLGLFLQPLTRDLALTVADFTLAIAVQNAVWGLTQPIAGAWAVRLGFRPLMVGGALCYVAGLAMLSLAQGLVGVIVGAGVLIGVALSCNASAMALAVASRTVSVAMRSTVLGIVTAVGSLGAVIAAPVGQMLTDDHGWRWGAVGLLVVALAIVPGAWLAGRIDKVPLPARDHRGDSSGGAALRAALTNSSFLIMAGAYFVCGMQLIFLTAHLPSYLTLCGMDPMLGAQALMVIAVFNVVGSLFFGWAGGRWSKQMLLGVLYVSRSLVLGAYFAFPPTPLTTVVFAAFMGFLWLGVSPLISGTIAEMFGLRWQAMIQGIAFLSHQVGSFVGVLGGGLLFDALGSYDLAVKLGVGMGLTAGILQIVFSAPKPPRLDRVVGAG
jgi:predicted MFS family arabinose efflux permease